MQNYYYQPGINSNSPTPFVNDTYINRLQRLNQLQNQFNSQYTNTLPLNNQIIFVQGETGAKAYQIPNNTTVLLMSSENNEFFIKTTDSSGFPTIRKFTFQEHPTQEQQPKQCSCNCQNNSTAPLPLKDYVTQEEFNNFKKEILNFYESNLSNGKPAIGNKKSNDGYNDKKLIKRNDTKTNGNESDEK